MPFEHNEHERKTHKYAKLVLDISQNGYNCIQTPTKEFLRYFPPSLPNRVSHLKNTSIRLPSSLTIPSGMLATNQPGGPRTNLTSNCNCSLGISGQVRKNLFKSLTSYYCHPHQNCEPMHKTDI